MHAARNYAAGTMLSDPIIRRGPASGADNWGTVKKGSTQILRGNGLKWYGISSGNTFGYIPADSVKVTTQIVYDDLCKEKVTETVAAWRTTSISFRATGEGQAADTMWRSRITRV